MNLEEFERTAESEGGVRRGAPRPQPRLLLNLAGEPEREARSRRANLAEALTVMMMLLGSLWCLAYPLGVVLDCRQANVASRVLVGLLLAFALLVSPWWHGDTLQARGLGSPAALVRFLRRLTLPKRLAVGALLGASVVFLAAELYRNATGAARLVLGVQPVLSLHLQQNLGSQSTVLVCCFGLALIWVGGLIRYDNLWPALKAAASMLGLLLPLLLLLGWAVNGPEAFAGTSPGELVRRALGYSFWGALQQLLFCGYFGTRLRKGVRPACSPPVQRWKRLAVALLNGLFFGLVHINSWLLVGFTWVLGTVLAWFFMEDRYRNLQALGLVHGVLGTCVVWLFSGKQEMLTVRLRVGPWAMPHHLDVPTLVVSGTLLLGFAVAVLLLVRSSLKTVNLNR